MLFLQEKRKYPSLTATTTKYLSEQHPFSTHGLLLENEYLVNIMHNISNSILQEFQQ